MDINKIYCCDVLDGLKQLDENSVDLIITSPPYNKAGLNGKRKTSRWFKSIDYGGDPDVDNKPEDEYQEWQVRFLKECYRVIKQDGSLFYNHKPRTVYNKGYVINPLEWIYKTEFLLHQEIIWLRCGSQSANSNRYLQDTERIYWLTKRAKPRFKMDWKNCQFNDEVWKICPDKNNKHPAPMPIEIPDNIIPCVAQGQRILVLDPFMGSGTVAVSAIKNGCDYIGFEKFQTYVDMTNDRINKV